MNYLQKHYFYITQKELFSKFYIKNFLNIPKITKIILNINIFNKNTYFIIPTILVLELITNQQSILTKTKKLNIQLKIKKNNIIGCNLILKKKKLYFFLQSFLFFILPFVKTYNLKINGNTFTFKIFNILLFFELKKYFDFFHKIKTLNITIKFNTTNITYIKILLTSLKFYIKN